MRILFFFLSLLCVNHFVLGQFMENFQDETKGNTPDQFNPTWFGNTNLFVCESSNSDKLLLRSNAGDLDDALDYYIATPSIAIHEAEWQFFIDIKFNPSGANYVDVFLVSDKADLTNVSNGYFVRIGDTNDWITFNKVVEGKVTEELISSKAKILNTSGSKPYIIKVTRNAIGSWSLLLDKDATGTFSSAGTITDTDIVSSNYFGLFIQQSSATSPANNHYFDDFVVTGNTIPDTEAPKIDSVVTSTFNRLYVLFDEEVDQTSAEEISNYSITGANISNAHKVHTDSVLLEVLGLTNGQHYTLTISNVQDKAGNVIETSSTKAFRYLVLQAAEPEDVVVNEFMASPNDLNALPDAEFIELYNNSTKFIELEGWSWADETGVSGQFSSYLLEPDSYLILTGTSNSVSFESYGNTLSVSRFRALNGTGDSIVIYDASDQAIFATAYSNAVSGISTELINPNGPDFSEDNYGFSSHPRGGTPGVRNSVFDDTPDMTVPTLISITVLSSTALLLEFSESVERSSAENITNYAIADNHISHAQRSEKNRYEVILTLATLMSGVENTLTVMGVKDLSDNEASDSKTFTYIQTQTANSLDIVINEYLANPREEGSYSQEYIEFYNKSEKYIDLSGWRIADNTDTTQALPAYVLYPNSYLLVSADTSIFDLENAIEITSFRSLNNFGDRIILLNNFGQVIHELSYTSSTLGIANELINPETPCITSASYTESLSRNGGTPGVVNSVFDTTPDTLPPEIISFGYDTTLKILFSEPVDAQTIDRKDFVVSGLTINSVTFSGKKVSEIEISFLEDLKNGEIYTLRMTTIKDCVGNEIVATEIQFGIPASPSYNELIITEIMYDPKPTFILPEVEYLEIYNATDRLLSLENVMLEDATSKTMLPSFLLSPKTYYVLVSNTASSQYVNEIGVSGFPTLNNTGERLRLLLDDQILFSVTFSPDWHTSELTAEGGFSLEMLDITHPCIEKYNWTSSEDVRRGTPSTVNSVRDIIVDNFGPKLVDTVPISADTLLLTFSEKLSDNLTAASAFFDPIIPIKAFYSNQKEDKQLFLVLDKEMEANVPFVLEVSGVFDCSGNKMTHTSITTALPIEPVDGLNSDILLSEVLFNPTSNGVDFVELYNNSDNFYSLKNWQLARLVSNTVGGEVTITSAELVFKPKSYIVLTTDPKLLKAAYPNSREESFFTMHSFPSYPNSEGVIILLDKRANVIQRFLYNEDYHYSLLKDVEGVSLERLSFSASENDPNNWRSASSTVGFATPGYANSQSITNTQPMGSVEVKPKVFIPGDSFTTIHYEAQESGKFANIKIYDHHGRLVMTLAEGISLASQEFIRWDGTTNKGQMARLGYYVIVLEIFDSNGHSEVIKETVVVGRNL